MAQFENKLVAVMNKRVEPGKVLNALAHMCIAFGSHLGKERLHLVDYIDGDGNRYADISKMPFIILRGDDNKLKKLRVRAIEEEIELSTFTDTMTIGSWDEQLARTRITKEADISLFGLLLYGPWDKVSEMTKKFSLWK